MEWLPSGLWLLDHGKGGKADPEGVLTTKVIPGLSSHTEHSALELPPDSLTLHIVANRCWSATYCWNEALLKHSHTHCLHIHYDTFSELFWHIPVGPESLKSKPCTEKVRPSWGNAASALPCLPVTSTWFHRESEFKAWTSRILPDFITLVSLSGLCSSPKK